MFLPQDLKIALNIISIFFAAFFIAPTIAIVASWNALPGDSLYATKRTLEKIALAITAPNYQTNTNLQSKLIARRTSEATATLLKKSSNEGLEELKAQASALRQQIQTAPSASAKRQAAIASVHELYRTKRKLAQTKLALAQAPPPTTNTSPSDQLVDDIEDTEEDIDDIIDDIEEDPDIGEIPEPPPAPTAGKGGAGTTQTPAGGPPGGPIGGQGIGGTGTQTASGSGQQNTPNSSESATTE